MKPLFTIHEGEFLVGDYIIRNLSKKYDVWIPAKDTGIDILLTSKKANRKPIKVQVKFSRSFPFKQVPSEILHARGWYMLDPNKVKKSKADLWIFVILTLRHKPYYILTPTKEVIKNMNGLMKSRSDKKWHLYPTVLNDNRCYDLRGLSKMRFKTLSKKIKL